MSDRKSNFIIFLELNALIVVGWWWRVAESCLGPAKVRTAGGLQVHGIRSCRLMWLRLDQTMRNLTSGDLGILLVVIQLRVTGLKKTKVVYLLDLFEGRGEKGQ